jgi:hypothetical protein
MIWRDAYLPKIRVHLWFVFALPGIFCSGPVAVEALPAFSALLGVFAALCEIRLD